MFQAKWCWIPLFSTPALFAACGIGLLELLFVDTTHEGQDWGKAGSDAFYLVLLFIAVVFIAIFLENLQSEVKGVRNHVWPLLMAILAYGMGLILGNFWLGYKMSDFPYIYPLEEIASALTVLATLTLILNLIPGVMLQYSRSHFLSEETKTSSTEWEVAEIGFLGGVLIVVILRFLFEKYPNSIISTFSYTPYMEGFQFIVLFFPTLFFG